MDVRLALLGSCPLIIPACLHARALARTLENFKRILYGKNAIVAARSKGEDILKQAAKTIKQQEPPPLSTSESSLPSTTTSEEDIIRPV